MNKEVHWLLDSLNDYIHSVDVNNHEVLYWRKRFLDENVIDEKNNNIFYQFLAQPSWKNYQKNIFLK